MKNLSPMITHKQYAHTHLYEENEHPEKESETKNFYFNVMNLSAKFERE